MSTATQSIRQIVATQPSAASVLQRFDIDLCAQADTALDQACADLQLSVDQVLEKLADAYTREHGAPPADPAALPTTRLIQHIVRTHHQCVRQDLPRLAEMAHKVAEQRSNRAPELHTVASLIDDLRAGLFAHIHREEQVLFPFITQMDQDTMVAPMHDCFHTVRKPISVMLRDHDEAGRTVAELHRLTNGFQPPAWACATHTALYSGLGAFQADLVQHVHLENDILFPRAAAMETALNTRR
jgi:regulator of cell morphogenesis and NO signaling